MNFMFSWQERYPTRSLRSLVRYCSCHSNIKFIPSRHRVISSITRSLQTEIFYKSSVDGTQSRLNENVVWTNSFVICETNLLQEKNKHVICRLRVGPYSENCDLGLENAALGLRPRAVFQDHGHSFSLHGPPGRQTTYIFHMTCTAPRAISMENHKRKGLVWGPYASKW